MCVCVSVCNFFMRLIMRPCVGVNVDVDVDTAFCFVIVVKKLLTVNRKMKQAKTCRLSAPISPSLSPSLSHYLPLSQSSLSWRSSSSWWFHCCCCCCLALQLLSAFASQLMAADLQLSLNSGTVWFATYKYRNFCALSSADPKTFGQYTHTHTQTLPLFFRIFLLPAMICQFFLPHFAIVQNNIMTAKKAKQKH